MRDLRVLIVDDEPLAVERLIHLLRDAPGVVLAGTAGDGEQALAMAAREAPDVVILDIRMPLLDGLEAARALTAAGAPAIIFVTAHGRFAVEAFDVAAVDYLLKPVSPDRLLSALERARRRLDESTAVERAQSLQQLLDFARREAPADIAAQDHALWVNESRGRVRVPLSAIVWLESEREYVRVHTAAKSHLIRASLYGLAARLDPALFMRVHRSSVVALTEVTGLSPRGWGLASATLSTGAVVPVGRAYVAELKSRLSTLTGG